jgi:hypothetical protein
MSDIIPASDLVQEPMALVQGQGQGFNGGLGTSLPATFSQGYVTYADMSEGPTVPYANVGQTTWSGYSPQFYFGVWGDAGHQPITQQSDGGSQNPPIPAPPACGVIGSSSGGSGVIGITSENSSAGVYGAGQVGVAGFSEANPSPSNPDLPTNFPGSPPGPVGVYGSGSGGVTGVGGSSDTGSGVSGSSQSGAGVGGSSDTGSGVSGSSQSGAGVGGSSTTGHGMEGSSAGSESSGVRGNNTSSGPGVSGNSTAGEGGVFQSVNAAQLRLVPSSTPLEDTSLMQTGQVGDLYLFSVAQEVGTSGTYDYNTILWLCIAPVVSAGEQAVWAPVQLGDTVGG